MIGAGFVKRIKNGCHSMLVFHTFCFSYVSITVKKYL